MSHQSTPSYVAEIPLEVSPSVERELLIRFELGRQLKNAVLGEALYRLDRCRASLDFIQAKAEKNAKIRREKFREINKKYKFTEFDIQAYACECIKNAKWNEKSTKVTRVGAKLAEKIAQKVFQTVEQYAFGKKGRPRFLSKLRPLKSMESKTNQSGILWKKSIGSVKWSDLIIPALLPPNGKDVWLEKALQDETKYTRILWRMIKGQRRWFAQLTQKGIPPQKYVCGNGKAGIDIGPSNIAVYAIDSNGNPSATYETIASEVEQPWKESRQILRAMDRSRRATNPHCYNENGTWKKGQKVTVRSKRYQKRQARLAETERVLVERRKRAHGVLSNQILAQANTIQAEQLFYVSFQKNYGRSTKVRGAGSLMSTLQRKAESAGGTWVDLNTRILKLSQYDHSINACKKKPLSQRWHIFEDGRGVIQRDCYSAYLAMNVDTSGSEQTIHPNQCEQHWSGAQTLLGRVGWMYPVPSGTQLGKIRGLPRIAPNPTLPKPVKVLVKKTRRQTQSHAESLQPFTQEIAQTDCVQARGTLGSNGQAKITCNSE